MPEIKRMNPSLPTSSAKQWNTESVNFILRQALCNTGRHQKYLLATAACAGEA